MITKCACGSYTDYGAMCVSCAMAKMTDDDSTLEVDIEDYLEEEDEDEPTSEA